MNELIADSLIRLPKIPVSVALDGKNLDKKYLIPRSPSESPEQAMIKFRMAHSPEKLPYFRRYYLKPHARGQFFTGRYSIRYVWNPDKPSTDRTVGTFKGDDLPAAQVLIGNSLAGKFLLPISWQICEDRYGEEPVAVGRYDVWSLLKDVSSADIHRLEKQGIVPDLDNWDFDQIFFKRTCPGCGKNVSVNSYFFNIDSAKCSYCGIRPFLSRSLINSLNFLLPTATGKTTFGSSHFLLQVIQWLGGVNASVQDLHQEGLPDEFTPHSLLQHLLENSHLILVGKNDEVKLHPAVISKIMDIPDGKSISATVQSAAGILVNTIRTGAPLTPIHAAMANMLRTLQ